MRYIGFKFLHTYCEKREKKVSSMEQDRFDRWVRGSEVDEAIQKIREVEYLLDIRSPHAKHVKIINAM